MDNSCAALVDAQLVPVGVSRGAYPDDALWGEPNLEQAASWMQRLATKPELVRTKTAKALERMRSQPSDAELGHRYASLLTAAHTSIWNHDDRAAGSAGLTNVESR